MNRPVLLRSFQLLVRADVPTGSYLLACPETRKAAWIDPAADSEDVARTVETLGLTVTHVLVTHSHYDHIGGVGACKKRWRCAVLVHPGDAWGEETGTIAHEETVRIGNLAVRAVETPGHTPGGMTYLAPGVAFTGDALFAGSVGGTGNRRAFQQQLFALWERVLSLPEETLLCPGHGPMSTVGAERRHNPFLTV